MRDLTQDLSSYPFFRGLPLRYAELIAGCASNVRFDAGRFIFREGQAADKFYIIRYGRVVLETFSPEKGAVAIESLSEGDVLGWSWLISPYRWKFDARAAGPVRAIAFDGKCLRDKCEEDHDLGYALLQRVTHVMEHRLQATRLQLLDLYGTHR